MNKEITNAELEEQSKQAVIAYLQDSSVGLEFAIKNNQAPNWKPCPVNIASFNLYEIYFRIAQPKPCYRVFECKDGSLGVTCSKYDNEEVIENQYRFSRWLTDRLEYKNE